MNYVTGLVVLRWIEDRWVQFRQAQMGPPPADLQEYVEARESTRQQKLRMFGDRAGVRYRS